MTTTHKRKALIEAQYEQITTNDTCEFVKDTLADGFRGYNNMEDDEIIEEWHDFASSIPEIAAHFAKLTKL